MDARHACRVPTMILCAQRKILSLFLQLFTAHRSAEIKRYWPRVSAKACGDENTVTHVTSRDDGEHFMARLTLDVRLLVDKFKSLRVGQ
jgi:hypothetical protein